MKGFFFFLLLTAVLMCFGSGKPVRSLPLEYPVHVVFRYPRDLFRSSQQNADIVNGYYQPQEGDNWLTRNVIKPAERYVGRALGDEFPKVRDSIIDYQKQGMGFVESHLPRNGWNPKNWEYNKNNDAQELADPYED